MKRAIGNGDQVFLGPISQLGWSNPVTLFEQTVESSQTAETTSQRHVVDAKAGIGKKLLRQEQSPGPHQLNRRNSKLPGYYSSEMAIGEIEGAS